MWWARYGITADELEQFLADIEFVHTASKGWKVSVVKNFTPGCTAGVPLKKGQTGTIMQVDECGDTLIHFSEIDKQLSVCANEFNFLATEPGQLGYSGSLRSKTRQIIEKKNTFVPGSGYELVEGMRVMLSGKGPPPDPKGGRVLKADHVSAMRKGRHIDHSLCEVLGFHEKADVFLSHMQSEQVRTTLNWMRMYQQHVNEDRPARFWVDYVSLPQSAPGKGSGAEGNLPTDNTVWFTDPDHGLPMQLIDRIGMLAVPLTPWRHAAALKRLWCIYEVALAAGCRVPIVALLTDSEQQNF
eukprot:gene12015-38679_t